MRSTTKTLGAAALAVALMVILSGTASAQWAGGFWAGGCGSGVSVAVGGYYPAPAYPVYGPAYPVYGPAYPVYAPYPVYGPIYTPYGCGTGVAVGFRGHHRRHW